MRPVADYWRDPVVGALHPDPWIGLHPQVDFLFSTSHEQAPFLEKRKNITLRFVKLT